MANTDVLKGLAQGASYANPVVGGAFSVFNNIFSAISSAKQQQEAHRMAMAQSLYNSEIQRQLWNTQLREGPSRQVAGMKAAGLNPALAGGSSVGTPPLSSSPGSPVGANPIRLENPADRIFDAMRLGNETKVSDAQANAFDAQAEEIRSRIPGNQANSRILQDRADRYAEILDNEINKGKKEIGLLGEQSESERKRREVMGQQILEMQQNVEKMRSEVRNMDADTAYKKMKTVWEQKEIQAHINELRALAVKHGKEGAYFDDKAYAEIQNSITNMVLAKSEEERNAAQTRLAHIQADLTEKYGDAEKIGQIFGSIVGTAASSFLGVGIGAKALGLGGKAAVKVAGFFR